MDEYLEREAVLAYMSEVKAVCISNFEYEAGIAIEGMIYGIKDNEIPIADVAPVRHGGWIEQKSSGAGGIWDYYFVCSVCGGNTPNKAYVIAPDFCPNCGAKMDGKKK